jgi:hypothetical protein
MAHSDQSHSVDPGGLVPRAGYYTWGSPVIASYSTERLDGPTLHAIARPNLVSVFESYEQGHEGVAAPWVDLTPREARKLGVRLIELAAKCQGAS